ncbi:MAG TPA: Nif3-like dinuclear metal center hexameric protein [Bacteroidales bacterium]|nr:Nif3-like dinuclear metal center hexameric protein [Bacteroidales bacterium]HOR59926.1 Nif3-like dinuclear metal center hexameric protein [Bacteroidales bacterium]HPL03941.1 Nif3-like dinuclear metal center hexameric protein [Bacteroidales bacterium]
MKIKDIINSFEEFAPLSLQEEYDNSGLQVGNLEKEISGILISLDVTSEVVQEAIDHNCNFIIAHHPLIFNKLRKITGSDDIEKSIILAIKNDISIYCTHTNFDKVNQGVSYKICEKIGLKNLKILSPEKNILEKIAVFVPTSHADIVRNSMFEAGAGQIGNYDNCSYNLQGEGSFRASNNSNPFVGQIGETHFEKEVRIETIYPKYLRNKILQAILKSHPYEEVAYDIYKLENPHNNVGLGMIGELEQEVAEIDFLKLLKEKFNSTIIKHSEFLNKKIKKVAVCGGSGAFLINTAKSSKADVFVSGDIKFHDYFLAEKQILIADIGHFESEQFTKEIFYDIIMKKNPNFAVRFSKKNINPIKTF